MAASKQYVISLNKLILPSQKIHVKVILSVATSSDQCFIQNQKVVKGNKINFYRQNLFIHEYSSEFWFNLYEIDSNNEKMLIKSFQVSKQEFITIQKRPTMFCIKVDNYQLHWDGWIFSQDSSYLNQQSEKDYTQLDLPFENIDQQNLSQVLANSHSQNSKLSRLLRINEASKKRSSSTQETSSAAEKRLQISESDNKSSPPVEIQPKIKIVVKTRNTGSLVENIEKRKKTHIKSHLYSSLITGISQLLSPAKA